MATGKFVWLVGDDDLLMPKSLNKSLQLIRENADIDFFYVNAFHLDAKFLENYKHPFDTIYLPKSLDKFSNYNFEGKLPFLKLISPKVSFDFLGGVFLSIFRKSKWDDHKIVLDKKALYDKKLFSEFDNTFPHVKIFSRAFSNSMAYYSPNPTIICLSGIREWTDKYPLIRSFRLLEGLIEYRKNGLPFVQYMICKNFALSHYIPDVLRMLINYKVSGIESVNVLKVTLSNIFYINLYLSPLIEVYKKLKYLVLKRNNNE